MSTGAKFIVSAAAFWVAAGVVSYYVFSRAIVKKRPTYFANIYTDNIPGEFLIEQSGEERNGTGRG